MSWSFMGVKSVKAKQGKSSHKPKQVQCSFCSMMDLGVFPVPQMCSPSQIIPSISSDFIRFHDQFAYTPVAIISLSEGGGGGSNYFLFKKTTKEILLGLNLVP